MSSNSVQESVSQGVRTILRNFSSTHSRTPNSETRCKHETSDIELDIDNPPGIWTQVERYTACDTDAVESYFVETEDGFHEYTNFVYVFRCLGCGTTKRMIRGEKQGFFWKKHMDESDKTEFRKTHNIKPARTVEKQLS